MGFLLILLATGLVTRGSHRYPTRLRRSRPAAGLMPYAVIVFAMVFFGWLIHDAPPFLAQPVLPIVAMVCVVGMFGCLMWRRFR